VSANNAAIPTNSAIPQAVSARGAFVILDGCEPELLEINTLLALDSRGVFIGDACNLNRVVSGHAYAVNADNLNGNTWFTFGPRFSTGATLNVATNNSNGGWNLVANLRQMPIPVG